MAKLNELFEEFRSSINPNQAAVNYAISAHKPVRECLENEDVFKQYVEGTFLYGSYKRHTAVGDIKDVDIVVLTNFDIEDEDNTPKAVLRKLKAALSRCYDDPENPQYQRRSIRIDDPLPDYPQVEMTLDIIPAVVVTNNDSALRVPDRDVDKWILTHPKGHLKRASELNSNKNYVPLVKIMKWWWKYQCEIVQPEVERPKPKGFWIECLTAENFDKDQGCWADHFIVVLENVSAKYSSVQQVPELADPGLEGETIKTNMSLDEFEVFLEVVNDSLDKARLARDASDKLASSELWREVFGENFPLYEAEDTEESREASTLSLGAIEHAESPPWPIRLHKRHQVSIDAYEYVGANKISGRNSNGRIIRSERNIKFVAKTRNHGDFQVYWQVVNTGEHAKQANGLRGKEFFEAKRRNGEKSQNQMVTWERTEYTGKHWIECFIVKDGVCVGRSGRFYVNVRNPDYP